MPEHCRLGGLRAVSGIFNFLFDIHSTTVVEDNCGRITKTEQSEASKTQRPRVDEYTASKEGTSSDADPNVEMSDHGDSKVEEEEAKADESSVMLEGVNW